MVTMLAWISRRWSAKMIRVAFQRFKPWPGDLGARRNVPGSPRLQLAITEVALEKRKRVSRSSVYSAPSMVASTLLPPNPRSSRIKGREPPREFIHRSAPKDNMISLC